ncbi:eEF1A lysine and N-terminal methyltransferase-like [Clavelina lepadiformis]|uniref:eEF1A lysine and N-terminal methyltransferase-like n=1 Tax=Clavelina lepadiformis TaxID=159417 RepID=UPI004043698B
MDLLPKSSSDFHKAEYWEEFFTKRTKAFEWYGNYFELSGILLRYIKPKDDILVIGCGNSELSEKLYDGGFLKILNIDISTTVIDQMKQKNVARSEMKWEVMDAAQLKLDDESCSVVLDKGTLDAILSDYTSEVNVTAGKMFKEIERVLRLGGRYICITLAQDPLVSTVLQYLKVTDWLLRVHKVSVSYHKDYDKIQMPVFAIVLTKFRNLPRKILEVCLEDATKPSKLESEEQVLEFIKTQQNYAIVRNELAHGYIKNLGLPSVELHSSDNIIIPRYKINIVDLETYNPLLKYGVFIIPQGRESEWLFSSPKGRLEVAKNAQFKRLAIVALSRDHVYEGGMQQIQKELSLKVMELAPASLDDNYKVPFLSIGGDDIGERHVRYRGESEFTGPFVIEDYVGSEGVWYRQLLFSSAIVQSVVRLTRKTSQKKTNKKQKQKLSKTKTDFENLTPDPSYLTSQYLQIMVAGYTGILDSMHDSFRVLILGLGGGSLAFHTLHFFPNSHVTAVELDGAVADVCRNWFGVSEETFKSRLDICIEDGVSFVENMVKKMEVADEKSDGYLFDIVVIDVDSKDDTKSLRAPPAEFITEEAFENIKCIVKPRGALMVNVLCRDQKTKMNLFADIQKTFPLVYTRDCESDVNTVAFCYKNDGAEDSNEELLQWHSKAQLWEAEWKRSNPDNYELVLCDFLENVLKFREPVN